ncbi:kinase-like protein [Pyrenochaeta sp. DS3sAY3a]|nr:kinase-like protein [Pyrenochaeta sp. DS3sAY3a]
MRAIFRNISAFRRRSPSPLPRISTAGFTTLDSAAKIEEERLPHYDQSVFYPVRIGEIFEDRYQVLGKLGFGSNSTVCFCRDLKKHQHIALKVCISSPKPSRELEVLKHLAVAQASHAGAHFMRTLLDSFVIRGEARLTEDMLKTSLQQVFAGLDFLHGEAKVVHTAKNIMLSCSDSSVFDSWEKSEIGEPAPRKVDGNRIIYKSREFNLKRDMRSIGRCMITDLGMARIGVQHAGFIQPEVYRAPEVMLCMPWTSAADIWNVGVMIWDLFEGRHMFHPGGSDRKLSNARMLGEMIALLGPPPSHFLRRADETLAYWNHDAQWKGFASIPEYALEDIEEYLEGESKDQFMVFMRKMLQWEPERRHSALNLLQDQWLNS